MMLQLPPAAAAWILPEGGAAPSALHPGTAPFPGTRTRSSLGLHTVHPDQVSIMPHSLLCDLIDI